MYEYQSQPDDMPGRYCVMCLGTGLTTLARTCGFCNGSGLWSREAASFLKYHPCYCRHGDAITCTVCRQKCHHDTHHEMQCHIFVRSYQKAHLQISVHELQTFQGSRPSCSPSVTLIANHGSTCGE